MGVTNAFRKGSRASETRAATARLPTHIARVLPVLVFLTASIGVATASPKASPVQIDHVILATADLEAGVRALEAITGATPVYGGSHPDRDTHNAIVPLSGGMYIEILAPKDGLEAIPDFFEGLDQLTLVGFALSVRDLERAERTARALGLDTNGIEQGSRKTPNGGRLAWRLLLLNDAEMFMKPFFISWSEDSAHPSKARPPRCALANLKLTTPHKKQLERMFSELGGEVASLTLVEGVLALGVELDTPEGRVMFGSE